MEIEELILQRMPNFSEARLWINIFSYHPSVPGDILHSLLEFFMYYFRKSFIF